MSYQISPNVEQLIRDKMASGHYESEDQLLIEALQALDDSKNELRAIEEGLASVEHGEDGVPLDVAFQRLRQKHDVREPQ